jgi:hypothetical protein
MDTVSEPLIGRSVGKGSTTGSKTKGSEIYKFCREGME